MAVLEGKRGKEVFDEWRSKVLPTFALGCGFWIPAQAANFRSIAARWGVDDETQFGRATLNLSDDTKSIWRQKICLATQNLSGETKSV
jgi:hypothetical protein